MKNAALLVIDIQRGAFDGERCAPIDRPATLVESALELIGAARASGTPVVFVKHCDGAGEVFEEGSSHWELHESLVPQTGDKVLKKYASSAFEGTDLATALEEGSCERACALRFAKRVLRFQHCKLRLGHGVCGVHSPRRSPYMASKTKPAFAISERVNQELKARGASLASTAALAQSLREPRT